MLATKMRIRWIREIEIDGLGDVIRKARLLSGKTVDQLCDEVGVSRTYWYDIEKETLKGTLSFENLQKIKQVLSIDLEVRFDD